MSLSEYRQQAKEALETLYEIEDIIESALADSENYWTWAGFFSDKKEEILPLKDRGKQAVDQLQESVESIRSSLEGGELSQVFDEIDRNKERVIDVVDELREFAGVKAAVMEGDKLADLLDKLLDRFRDTSEAVETLINKLQDRDS
ncbi:MAG: hypothetical protein ABEK50_01430 [bacterium]